MIEFNFLPAWAKNSHDTVTVKMTKTDTVYEYSNPEKHWCNYNLTQGQGDEAFEWAMDLIAEKVDEYQPAVILLATGADGHEGEHWGLKYTYEGFNYAAKKVAELANKHCQGRVLIGGAAGYQPLNHTPRIWADVVSRVMEPD